MKVQSALLHSVEQEASLKVVSVHAAAYRHVFDFVALSVQRRIMRNRDLSVGPRRNAGGDFAIGKGVSKPVSVIPLVCKQYFGVG